MLDIDPKEQIQKIIKGLGCETCSDQRTFGSVPNGKPDNIYIYTDLGGSTRVFCRDHVRYDIDDQGTKVAAFGAILMEDLLKIKTP